MGVKLNDSPGNCFSFLTTLSVKQFDLDIEIELVFDYVGKSKYPLSYHFPLIQLVRMKFRKNAEQTK